LGGPLFLSPLSVSVIRHVKLDRRGHGYSNTTLKYNTGVQQHHSHADLHFHIELSDSEALLRPMHFPP
jgi:hypothetical protein